MNCLYYHATSRENAENIYKEGFKCGKSGWFGGGIYFAEKPKCAYNKALSSPKNAIIVVTLNLGRVKELTHIDRSMCLTKINKLGYDSVRMQNIPSGAEICLYESHRITIKGILWWSEKKIFIYNINDLFFDSSGFSFLTRNRKIKFNDPFYLTFKIDFDKCRIY